MLAFIEVAENNTCLYKAARFGLICRGCRLSRLNTKKLLLLKIICVVVIVTKLYTYSTISYQIPEVSNYTRCLEAIHARTSYAP